jgi:AcrR family transcriptional regulator
MPQQKSPPGESASSGRGVRVPQQARSRRTREAVLDTAVACFEAQGFDETTTAMIAERAGVGVGTVYEYFRDKREILLELLDRAVGEQADFVVGTLDPGSWRGSDPRETVRKLIEAVFEVQKLRPGIQRILWERYFKDDDFHRPFEVMRARIREAIEVFAEAVAQQGLLRELDREHASLVIVNAVQWNATHAFLDGSPEEIQATARATADMVERFIFRD